MKLLEVEYRKFSDRGVWMRRQLLQTPGGWTLSNAVDVDQFSPDSLRGWDGGYAFSKRQYPRRVVAERVLERNGYFRVGDEEFRATYRGGNRWELLHKERCKSSDGREFDGYLHCALLSGSENTSLATLVDRYRELQKEDDDECLGTKARLWEGVLDD